AEGTPRRAFPTGVEGTPRRAFPTGGPRDPLWVRLTLTTAALLVLTWLILVPVVNVFVEAFGQGIWAYIEALTGDYNSFHSILMTLTVAPIAVALNLVFGVAAAWA